MSWLGAGPSRGRGPRGVSAFHLRALLESDCKSFDIWGLCLQRIALVVSVVSLAFTCPGFAAETQAAAPEAIIQNYCAAIQAVNVRSASMEMEIRATLPGQKQGRFHALRKINPFGRITYANKSFEGDTAVRNQVVERYLAAEAEAQQDQPASIAVTPANYKFQYKGLQVADARGVHVFQLTPRHKRKGLFKGEIWIDAASYLPVREAGNLIKSPSIFVKRLAFVRSFEIRGGIPVPLQVQSTVNTIFGAAEVVVEYSNFALDEDEEPGVR